ncbi:MAG: 5-carboxymethyl-2-hydroxymuconate Delta-isomerase [Sphingomonadales bacterium]|nr:5-carboxymethyl-2-hydroxymuconate Delta-isomerase [Sphingomonadales bacterium]
MPHCIIEYAKVLENKISPQVLIEATQKGALNSSLFALEDIKCRTVAFDNFLVGSGDKNFIHVTTKILSGRDDKQKENLSNCILKELLELGLSKVSLTVEVCDIDRNTYAKKIL